MLLLFAGVINVSLAQTSVQNFGTGTASQTSQTGSTTTIPAPTSGTTYARSGATAANAPIVISNGTNPLGSTGSFIRAAASTSTSVAKFSPWVAYTGGTEFYTSFKVLFGDASGGNTATTGVWSFYQGAGTMYSDANNFTGAQVFTGLQFTYTGSTVTLANRAAGAFNTTGLAQTSFNTGTVYTFEIVGNNKSTGTISYTYNGSTQSVAVQKFDLYANGTLIGDDLAEAQLPANTSVTSGTFIGVSSTSNLANIFVDDAIVYNAVPASIGVSPSLVSTPGSLSNLNYVAGSGPSTSQSIGITGVNLTGFPGNITISNLSATNFEVSSDNTTFGASATIPYTSATLSSTNVYIRLKSGLSANAYSGTIGLSGGGASQTVSVSGTVASPPSLTPSATNVTATSYSQGAGPAPSGNLITVSGANLTGFPGNITVTGSASYEVSTTTASSGFGSSATIPYTSATLSSGNIWIRLKAGLTQGAYNSETISISGGGAATVNISASGSVTAPAPTITPGVATLTGLNYISGSGPSASQSFTISGANLTGFPGNVTVTGTANFEVSADNTTFGNTATVPFTGASLSSSSVYVRLKAGLGVSGYNNEIIAISGGGANSSITVSGNVFNPPVITTPAPTSLTGFSSLQGTASTAQTFTTGGTDLQGNIVVTSSSSAYEISLTAGSGYASSVSITPASGTVSSTTIFVRLAATATIGNQSATINITSTSATSQSVTVSGTVSGPPVLTEVIFPQYIQGVNGTNNNRIPFAYRATISNLKASATYRYYGGLELTSAAASSAGAGNNIFPDYTGGNFVNSTSVSLATAGGYGTFTTDASGSFTGWFIMVPTANATRFVPGTLLNARIVLNDGVVGSSTQSTVISSTLTTQVINLVASAGANNGTGLSVSSSYNPKNFAFVYDNVAGTGRPLSGTFVESDGAAETTSFATFYSSGIDGVAGAFGMVIPNTNANGVRRIEQRNFTTGAIVGCPAVDANGVWTSGANTVNPIGGTTAVSITAGDINTGSSSSIVATAGTNGTISPAGSTLVACQGSQLYSITANTGYSIGTVTVDGVSQGAISSYTFNNVTGAHTISATFVVNNFTITAAAGSGGSISPNGSVVVAGGTNQTFTITPDACYDITSVSIDGTDQGVTTSYTFTNVNTNHTISATFAPSTFTQWTGAVSSDWNNPANWTSCVPTAGKYIYIPGNGDGTPIVTRQPVLSADAATGDLELGVNSTLTIGSHTLTINGLFADDGNASLIGSPTSNLVINGTNGSTFLTLASTGTIVLQNLTINGGIVTLTTPLDIAGGTGSSAAGVVTIANGAVLESNGFLTIKSNQFGTARIAQANAAGSYVTGDVTVERYIPNNGFRSWRLLSVPTTGTQTIRQAWQEGAANPGALDNNKPGFGTQITGTGALGAAITAGFDNVTSKGALLRYNNSGNNWINATGTNTAIATKEGYFLFIRGDRSQGITGATTTTNATTLRTTGALYLGTQTSSTLPANSFALVGNLYVSPVNFTGLTRNGGVAANNFFYVWDSKKMNGSSLGAYQLFSSTDGFNCNLSGGSYVFGQPNTTIESGQAFFVQTGGTTGTVTFNETAKTSSQGSLGFRPASIAKLSSRLYSVANNNMEDANVVVFDDAYSNGIGNEDAPKFANPGENFGIQKGDVTIAVEGRKRITGSDTLFYKLWNLRQQQYQLELAPTDMDITGLTATLEDKYLHSSTPVNLSATGSINFTVDANAASAAADRFMIVFRQAVVLPVSFISISAARTSTAVQVNWQVAAERDIRNYVVERSADGSNFIPAGTITAINASTYQFNDIAAPAGTVFYRIKSVATSGNIQYTGIVKVSGGKVTPAFSVSPNPVEGGIVNLQFINQEKGRYTLKLISNNGLAVYSTTAVHAGGNSTQVINLPKNISRGTYQVEIVAPDKTRTTQALLVNSN